MFRALCAHHQEFKILLYSIWYHHTETSEWYTITKIKFYNFFVFNPMPPHVLYGLRGLPSWAWQKCN